MTKNVIALVGENAHRILACQSRRFLDLLAVRGLQGHVLDVAAPHFADRLTTLLEEGVLFAWGYAGVGARLALDGQSLWERARTPFISVLADAPFIMPANHRIASPWVVNGYIYQEWLDLQRSLFAASQIAALLPMGVIPNPAAAAPWSTRPHRMLFVKGGSDPTRQRRNWSAWPPQLRAVLNDCADTLAASGIGPILPTVQAALAAHGLALDGARHILFGLLHELDTYIRALRATTIATALLPLPCDIVGSGWDHLRHRDDARARFNDPVDAATLDTLYAETQILVNATPNFASGAHERVLRGFAARCRIASDDNAHARATLHALPSYTGFAWNDPGLTDRLADIFHDPASFEDRLDPAHDYVRRHHDPLAFLDRMTELAALVRMQDVMAGYMLDAT